MANSRCGLAERPILPVRPETDEMFTIEQVFQQASQSQAADQVSIGNSIGSLRFLGATEWREQFIAEVNGRPVGFVANASGVRMAGTDQLDVTFTGLYTQR